MPTLFAYHTQALLPCNMRQNGHNQIKRAEKYNPYHVTRKVTDDGCANCRFGNHEQSRPNPEAFIPHRKRNQDDGQNQPQRNTDCQVPLKHQQVFVFHIWHLR